MAHPLRLRIRFLYMRPLHWFNNKLLRLLTGRGQRQVFFDIEQTFPELRCLDENFEVIREELEGVLPNLSQVPLYHDVDLRQGGISALDERAWRVFFLSMNWAGKQFPTRVACPRTAELLDRIPHVIQAFFSILEPGKDVPHHDDPAMHYLRYHLALIVPAEKPPVIRVSDQFYTWKTGESMLFDDSWDHEVFNDSESLRVVLVVDILRPVIWPVHMFNRVLLWLRGPPRRQRAAIFERVVGGSLSAYEDPLG